ncbi:hypothetical protein Cgig2_012539 [Carnegiea gigantea]|uniref:Uncharacterized protein n=1 Tax=Carnegiea gigantea TaxID=171969 RepID=A0A9Q1JHI2_9CARY|nr:hypothetical protein Cgig2_012539 [Carnegiea gigantea]
MWHMKNNVEENTFQYSHLAKERKLASNIYTTKDNGGSMVKGFEWLEETILDFHKHLLGEQFIPRSHINPQNQCLDISGFKEGTLPLKYRGIPIIASRLTKIDQNPINSLLNTKGAKVRKCINYAIFAVVIYLIQSARNQAIFKNHLTLASHMKQTGKRANNTDSFFLNTISGKYTLYIDSLHT